MKTQHATDLAPFPVTGPFTAYGAATARLDQREMREAVIAQRLNTEGRPSRTGKPWAPETVRQIANRRG